MSAVSSSTPLPSDPQTLVAVESVSHMYSKAGSAKLLVLDDVNLTVSPGEIVALLGRSGSGKSTLLRIISGLLKPTKGCVRFGGVPIDGPSPGIAMVFQNFALLPWLTVFENVSLSLDSCQKISPQERRSRVLKAIDLIGLDGFESAYPRELSGGMCQRVGLARALVIEPRLLLMDEAFSALDVLTAETLRTELLKLWYSKQMAVDGIIMVTHNIEEAVLMCDRILLFSSNPGRISEEIVITLPHPRSRFTLEFRRLVDDIYGRMTAKTLPEPSVYRAPIAQPHLGVSLPYVSTNVIAGLIEALNESPYAGKADMPLLAAHLQMEVDALFPSAEALQLLGFADMDQGDIVLTPLGLRFAQEGVSERKNLFAQQLMACVPLVAHIRRVLDERDSHTAPKSRFQNELEDYMSEERAEETLRTVISWGRYGELLAYDEHTGAFSLDNPR